MVNVGLNMSSIVGIALAVSGAGLYFLRTLRPNLARDHDIFFAAVALLCGGILFFQGWRQDPILQFGQFMLAGAVIWFAYEAVRLRGVATEQAKRSTPIVDDERPVSRVYRAELDDLPTADERPISRRIRGSRDSRSSDDYYDDTRRRPSATRSLTDRTSSSDRPRRPRSADSAGRYEDVRRSDSRSDSYKADSYSSDSYGSSSYGSDSYGDRSEIPSAWDDEYSSSSSSRYSDRPSTSESRRSSRTSESSSKSRRPKSSRRSPDAASDYVDYQPVDYGDDTPRSSYD